jgi:predicted nucleotidyltransferase
MQKELKNKEQIFRLIQSNSQQIRSFGINKIGLFGSFVKNQNTDNSDIDFIVEFETEKKSYKSFIRLAFFLEELLGRKVDLLTNKSLSPYLGPQILNETEYVTLGN